MTFKEVIESKGFIEGVDFTIEGEVITALDKVRNHPEIPAILNEQGQEIRAAVPAWDEVYQENIPTITECKAIIIESHDPGAVLNYYLKSRPEARSEEDSVNIALVIRGDLSGWRFTHVPAPSVEDLYDNLEQALADAQASKSSVDKIAKGRAAREVCNQVLDFIAGENLERQLSIEEITVLQQTFGNAEAALRAGRPTLAKQLISAITPDGELVTQATKDTALSLLASY